MLTTDAKRMLYVLYHLAIVKMENQSKEALMSIADFISKFIP